MKALSTVLSDVFLFVGIGEFSSPGVTNLVVYITEGQLWAPPIIV